jgi:hypothetical protein
VHASVISRASISTFNGTADRHRQAFRLGKPSLAFDTIYAEWQRSGYTRMHTDGEM